MVVYSHELFRTSAWSERRYQKFAERTGRVLGRKDRKRALLLQLPRDLSRACRRRRRGLFSVKIRCETFLNFPSVLRPCVAAVPETPVKTKA